MKGELIMFYDYHVHSNFSPDSKTSMTKMIETCINLGLKEVCFTDHMDYDVKQTDKFVLDYKEYLKTLELMQNKYKGKITIKKGIELGLQPHLIEKYNQDMKNYKFDFIICSQHAIDKNDLYYDEYFKNKSQKQAYEVYYKTLYDIIKNYNNYRVVGHVDLIKRYGNYSNILKDSLFIDIIESILKEAIYKGKGIEINTSCFRYKLPDLTPSRKIISLYKDLGGEIITTGSDAHSPAFISCKFDYICSYLKDLGFKYISTFNNLKPNFIKL